MIRFLTWTAVLLSADVLGSAALQDQPATPDNFLVFVGEKLRVDALVPKAGDLDLGFKAKYKIIRRLYGNYKKDTIEFEAYIHLGDVPAFSVCKNPLLYVSLYEGKWYHQKYMYDAVYRTTNGRWAGVGKSDDYDHEFNKDIKIKPEPIVFRDSVWFDLKKYTQEERKWFTQPYFRIERDRAYPLMGNYIEELFLLKKKGYLAARGLF